MTQPTEYENISYNAPGGSIYGATSTDRVAFYGVVPVARPVTISTNDVSTVIGRSTSSNSVAVTTWGFASQVEINNAITAVSTMQTTLKSLGIIAAGVQTPLTRSNLTFEVLDYGSTDGAQIGRAATEAIAFYGATPIVRNTFISNDISTATTVSASTNGIATVPWGWSTSSEFQMVNAAVSTMQQALKNLGLMV